MELNKYVTYCMNQISELEEKLDTSTIFTEASTQFDLKERLKHTELESRFAAQKEWYIWSDKITRARNDALDEAEEGFSEDEPKISQHAKAAKTDMDTVSHYREALSAKALPLRLKSLQLKKDPVDTREELKRQLSLKQY